LWFTAPQLQNNWVLHFIKIKVPWNIPMNQSTGGHHFAVKNSFFREAAMEGSALTISPIHHRGNGYAFGVIRHHVIL
jgi:hypothetical protein